DALIERIGAEHREHVVPDELLAQVLDEDILRLDAQHLGLAPRRLQLLALAEVGREGDDLAAVGLLQPLQDDRRVETARVGEHHLLDRAWLGGHARPLLAGEKFAAHYRQERRSGKAVRRAAHRGQEMVGWQMAGTSGARIEFWHDLASTYSYLSAMRIEALAAGAGVEILWKPVLLGPIFRAQGWDTSP